MQIGFTQGRHIYYSRLKNSQWFYSSEINRFWHYDTEFFYDEEFLYRVGLI